MKNRKYRVEKVASVRMKQKLHPFGNGLKQNNEKKGGAHLKTPAKLPIGIEDFKEIRTEGFYYVDKTSMITELLNNWSKINLFTRPRRFGKSLNMSMLKHFFSFGCDPELFQGLAVAEERELCDRYMGKFPVISITLKNAEAQNFKHAQALLCSIIGSEALRFQFLLDSERLSVKEKERYRRLIHTDADSPQEFPMSDDVLKGSLRTLSQLLCRYYGQKTVLLIDEYDVPLDRAQQNGYYDEMVDLIRGMFGQALKTNESHSIRDTAVRKERKENFYHDILIELPNENVGIVIELKYSESRNLEAACQKALEQIEEKNYAARLMEDDMDTILKYGIACRRNACMVRMAE